MRYSIKKISYILFSLIVAVLVGVITHIVVNATIPKWYTSDVYLPADINHIYYSEPLASRSLSNFLSNPENLRSLADSMSQGIEANPELTLAITQSLPTCTANLKVNDCLYRYLSLNSVNFINQRTALPSAGFLIYFNLDFNRYRWHIKIRTRKANISFPLLDIVASSLNSEFKNYNTGSDLLWRDNIAKDRQNLKTQSANEIELVENITNFRALHIPAIGMNTLTTLASLPSSAIPFPSRIDRASPSAKAWALMAIVLTLFALATPLLRKKF